jgi:aryl-alcohol dehydrogenase-like predicted oxidoreductase
MTTMTDLRPLGNTGLSIAPLVLGGNVFDWTVKGDAGFEILDAFAAGGGTMIDTADLYSVWESGHRGGESELFIGEWLKRRGHRDDIMISTKVGMLEIDGRKGLAPEHITRAVEGSLARLGTDYIDLYFAHCDDETVPQNSTLEAFESLIKAGKVRALGASNFSKTRLESALDVAERNHLSGYGVLQPWFNLADRHRFAEGFEQFCIAKGIGVLPYFSLASGFLSGKYRRSEDYPDSMRASLAREYLTPSRLELLKVMDAVAVENGASLAQIALAWLAAQPGVTAPIASASSVKQVEEIIASMHLRLSSDQFNRLTEASINISLARASELVLTS